MLPLLLNLLENGVTNSLQDDLSSLVVKSAHTNSYSMENIAEKNSGEMLITSSPVLSLPSPFREVLVLFVPSHVAAVIGTL